MARALSTLVFTLLGLALVGARTARADGGSDAAWDEERRAALKAALHEAEEHGDEKRAAAIRAELEAAGRKAAAAKQPATPEQLERRIAECREKAEALRAKGSVEDAEEWARKAAALQELLGVRRESGELEQKAHALKADGRVEEAEAAMKRAGDTWKRSLELEARVDGPRRDKAREGGKDRIEHMRAAAKHLREAGMGELAERIENAARQAEEQAAQAQKARSPDGEIEALRAQVAELQRMIEQLKARLDR